jgi:RNA polymerase sigma-70 factor, ECF subfamily
MLMLDQERDLVERAKTSSDAFGEIYDMYYRPIFGYAFRRTADPEAARDITSAVFFKALRGIKGYRWQGISISHWLYRIANRETIDWYKMQNRAGFHGISSGRDAGSKPLRDEITVAHSELTKNEDYLDLQACVAKLPAKYQEVIALRYFEDKGLRDIAFILEKPEGTVKSLLHRAVTLLRDLMEQQ